MQRLREQKVNEKLKYKNGRDNEKESENNVQKKSQSFYPDPRHSKSFFILTLFHAFFILILILCSTKQEMVITNLKEFWA